MKNRHYYSHNTGDLKRRLKRSVDVGELRELHKVRPARHFLVVARLLVFVALCGWALWQDARPWLWVPAAALQGFNILGFIILLHEQVHEAIFRRAWPRPNRALGLLYAFPSAISATQFRIWHLDHHNELGSAKDDPKRAHLSPKRNARWYKLLYFTPVLIFIYGRGATTEAREYEPADRRRIRLERAANLALHLTIAAGLWFVGGPWVMFRVWFVPLFIAFPPAFVLNRLGQHYDIDPSDPAKWSTLVNGNLVWHFLFLWSNFHIEHHYYPRVPFYNLRRLNERLQPFFEEIEHKNRTYTSLVWGWLVRNRQPHTNWDVLTEHEAIGAPRTETR